MRSPSMLMSMSLECMYMYVCMNRREVQYTRRQASLLVWAIRFHFTLSGSSDGSHMAGSIDFRSHRFGFRHPAFVL